LTAGSWVTDTSIRLQHAIHNGIAYSMPWTLVAPICSAKCPCASETDLQSASIGLGKCKHLFRSDENVAKKKSHFSCHIPMHTVLLIWWYTFAQGYKLLHHKIGKWCFLINAPPKQQGSPLFSTEEKG